MGRVLIIAEAGVNHNGDIDKAKALIDAAAEAKVDFVKFQTFKADTMVSRAAKKAIYQKKNTGIDDSQYAMLKALELSEEQHDILIDYCNKRGVKFFSTAFDVAGLDYLNSLGFEVFKVPSGELTNYPYLRALSKINKPVILSTGMSNLQEINEAIEVLTTGTLTKNDITVLHCNTEYPTPFQDVNLGAMRTIAIACDVEIGYSDHTLGIEVPIAAVALGAKVIEKHFTLDRNLLGPDHRASLEPAELKAMVQGIRNIEQAVSGDGKKKPSTSEKKNIDIARKSIHLLTDLVKGGKITEDNIIPLRPGKGLSPMQWTKIMGKTINKDLPAYHMLTLNDLNG